MKGFIASLLLLFGLIAGLFLYSQYTRTSITQLIDALDAVRAPLSQKEFSSASDAAETFDRLYEKEIQRLYFISERASLEAIAGDTERLKSYIQTQDITESSATLSGIRMTLSKTLDRSRLRLQNIF